MQIGLSTFEFQIVSKQPLMSSIVAWEYAKTSPHSLLPQPNPKSPSCITS